MKAYIKNYGCQMNEQDALQMRGLLARIGYSSTPDPQEADLILLVSCTIREKAEQKIYSDLGRARLIKEEKPHLIVGLAGCVAQQEKENLTKRFGFLDLIFGPDAIRRLPDMVKEIHQRRSSIHDPSQRGPLSGRSTIHDPIVHTRFDSRADFEFVNLLPLESENRVKAFVTIQKGCDHVCSFCIVPRVRGPEVSRPADDIILEIRKLVDLGVKEVTLLGQNVNSYGKKGTGGISFSRLLQRIAGETGIRRLRFTSSHPQNVDSDLIDQYRNLEVLSPHFHLPVQSGSNRILAAMRRYYTREDYLRIIQALERARPGMAFTTDIIVGFPGETDEDFQATLDLMRQARFDFSYSFVYSPRPGTQSSRLAEDLDRGQKEARLALLQELQKEISLAKNQRLVGSLQEVLVEELDERSQTGMGRTGTHKIVHFSGNEKRGGDLVGEMLPVRINQANPYSLVGESQKLVTGNR